MPSYLIPEPFPLHPQHHNGLFQFFKFAKLVLSPALCALFFSHFSLANSHSTYRIPLKGISTQNLPNLLAYQPSLFQNPIHFLQDSYQNLQTCIILHFDFSNFCLLHCKFHKNKNHDCFILFCFISVLVPSTY